MRRFTLLAFLLCLLFISTPFVSRLAKGDVTKKAEDDDDDIDDLDDIEDDVVEETDFSKVVSLTARNFEKVIAKSKFALVEFYAPWCGHCRQLEPHYVRAAEALKGFPDVLIAKVDASKEESLGTKYGVAGFPTLKWFVNGDAEKALEYSGGRDDEGITKWVKKRVGPASTPVADVAELKAMEAENAVLILGFFSSLESTDFGAYLSAAAKVEDSLFLHSTNAEVAAALDLKETPAVALIKNYAKLGMPREVRSLTGPISVDALKEFIDREKLPLTMEFTTENADRIFNSGISKQIIIWATEATVAASSETMSVFRKVAEKFRGRLVFVTSNNEGPHHEPVTDFFKLKGKGPAIVAFEMAKNKKWTMTEEFSEETLEAFSIGVLDDTYKGKAEEPKSQPVPDGADEDDDDVVVVVGKTVDTIVLDKDKDVLLEVYAPWCGHCKSLAPTYKKLAKRFRPIDSVVIAKMDATVNEHPAIQATGYPTILFFPAGEDQTPIPYSGGDRSLLALTKFIKEHAKIPYKLPKKGTTTTTEVEAQGECGAAHAEDAATKSECSAAKDAKSECAAEKSECTATKDEL